MSTVKPVTIPYSTLLLSPPPDDLPSLLQEAFGSSATSLGLLIISDLPAEFISLRANALRQAAQFAALSEATREAHASPHTQFSFGWSLGKESMKDGVKDWFKGSYYATPPPAAIGEKEDERNIWPKEGVLIGFEDSFKDLCKFMAQTGKLLARACDAFVDLEGGLDIPLKRDGKKKTIEELIVESRNSKARLLHYYPEPSQRLALTPSSTPTPLTLAAAASETAVDDAWCGTHTDTGMLTALCPAMFLFHPTTKGGEEPLEPLEIPNPSPEAGLWIETRGGKRVKAVIQSDCLAFQTGITLSHLTSARLAATPHFVSSSISNLSAPALAAIKNKQELDSAGRWRTVSEGTVSRETMAVFLQPNGEEVVSKEGITFGEVLKKALDKHY